MTKKQKIKWAIVLAVLIIFAIVILQNLQPVVTTVLFASFSMPLAALLLITFCAGVGAGFLLFATKRNK
jgi:uncharacterized integral membrane protein